MDGGHMQQPPISPDQLDNPYLLTDLTDHTGQQQPPILHKLHGTYVLLRYIARVASLPNFYGQNAYESGQLFSVNVLLHSNPVIASSQIDEWLEYAPYSNKRESNQLSY
ncbi:glutamate--trna ligase [Quercus suber]|uniref:Glutamate--trna ligase n=1 Tax=Quercus suber TaxID=58331 RepID=A0AAW0KPW1_QUESU